MRPAKLSVLIVVLSNLCFAQIQQSSIPTSYSVKEYLSFSSSITDSSRYNSYDFAGNPLGNLDRSTNAVELNLGYRLLHLSEGSKSDSASTYHGFVLPTINLRPSPNTHFSFNYSLQPIEVNNLSMPLHQFGFAMVSQTKNGIFRGGIAGQGYLGTEKQSDGSNTRTLMGVKDVGICIGSKINPTLNIGVYAHAAGFVDTLCNSKEKENLLEERFALIKLPQIDATADINMQKIPDHADLSYTYAKKHFVYTQKADTGMITFDKIAGNNGMNSDGSYKPWDADALVNDSIEISLQNMYRVDFENNMVYTPSFALGYMHNKYIRMKPGADNNPMSYNGQNSGYEWHTQSFRFGLGSAMQIGEVSKLWLEFYRSSLSLSLDGDQYDDSLRDSKSKGFYRFGCGTRFDISRVASMDKATDIAFIVGYLLNQQNALLSTYREETFSRVLPMTVSTQLERYTPWKQFREKVSSSSFHAGLHTAFKDEAFVTDLYFVYTSNSISGLSDRKTSELETGLDLTFNVKAHSKS